MKIKLTESKLKQIIAESVKKVLSETKKPSDRTVGKHTLKGLRYDKSGNPLYTSDTMNDDEKKNQGWKFSKKHGMYGQLSDPTKLHENDSIPSWYEYDQYDQEFDGPDSYGWSIYVGDKLIKDSKQSFETIEEAEADCNKVLEKIGWEKFATKWNGFDDESRMKGTSFGENFNFKEAAAIIYSEKADDVVLQNLGFGWMD